jgi:hypothetical protein
MRIFAPLVVFAAVVAGAPAAARAYPIFQLSTGAQRCNQCHIAPAGGGLISGYGRDEAGDTISRDGSGAFLHGLWTPPASVSLGADLRGAALLYDNGSTYAPSLAAFPMQADLYTHFKVSDFSATLTLGYRGSTRGQTAAPGDALGSREHYLMWRPKSQGPYVRLGKFRVPWSLRQPEHVLYVNRQNWMNLEEEPYGVSGGLVKNDWEFHASVYTGDPVRGAGNAKAKLGFAGQLERRQSETFLWGAQARTATFPDSFGGWSRHTVGGYGKLWLAGPRLLLTGELDVGLKSIPDADYTNRELLAYAGATWWATRGLFVTLSAEHFAEDLATADTGRTAGTVVVQLFPWAHVEVIAVGRLTTTSSLAMLQFHYYL